MSSVRPPEPNFAQNTQPDFLGDAAQAEALAERLHYRCRIPEPSDPIPKTAVILDENNQVVAEVLGMVAGLNETDILRRRVRVELARGHAVQVLRPFDCLASRLANVMLLPAKRSPPKCSPQDYDQLRAATGVCRAYLLRLAEQDRLQKAIKLANRIFDLAVTDAGKRVYFGQSIDLVHAIPEPEIFRTPAFTQENFPRQLERERQRRERFAAFLERRVLLG